MVTRAGWLLLVGSVITIVGGRVFGLPELLVLGATGVALVAVAVVGVRLRVPRLSVERRVHPARVPVGGRSRVELLVTNAGRRRTGVLTLHDPVEGTIGARVSLAPLAKGAHQTASYRLPTDRRGLVHIGPLDAQATDAFGLARRNTVVTGETVLTVLPAIVALTGTAGGSGLDDPLAGVTHPGVGVAGADDFSALRPYVVGDDMRRVHWASSARTGELVVRQDDPPWRGHLTLMLDGREDRIDAERFELAVSAAASILHAVALRGDRARLIITDGTDTGLTDARSSGDTLLEHLALVDRHPGTDLPEAPADGRIRTGGLVLVTGSATPDDVARFATHRDRYASARIVTIDPSAVGGQPEASAVAPGRGIEVVRVDAATSFALAWHSAGRAAVARS